MFILVKAFSTEKGTGKLEEMVQWDVGFCGLQKCWRQTRISVC